MNIRNALMPLLLSVHHAEADLYECYACACINIYISNVLKSLVRAWYQTRLYQPATTR